MTVYSTDDHKHELMKRMYPDVGFIQGDIRNAETIYNAMVGMDVVLHLAAVKVIPTSEIASMDTIDVNVLGSEVVCACAHRAGIQHVLGISTDKACHPANAYGASKYLMEKVFQEYARYYEFPRYHLVRYGNVLESTGSVIEVWKKANEDHKPIRMTDPEMTRFWLSPSQAVKFLIDGMNVPPGCIYIPKVPALSIGKLAEYALNSLVDRAVERVPLRPGEKMHETLLTLEETWYTATWDRDNQEGYVLRPTTSARNGIPSGSPYTSDMTRQLTQTELLELLND
jgi:FlaA1/EpsC-like NDP-sugar epimerase